MRRAIAALGLLAALGLAVSHASAHSRPLVAPEAMAIYQRLLPQIARIKLFDHHAHPAFPDDPDVDIAPPPPGATMLRLRAENPETTAAARALFGFPFADMAGAHGKWLVDRKAALKRQYPGPAYFNHVLDQLGIETSMANRVAMADYLDPARFKWVFFVDCFMFPFDNTGLATNPDRAVYMPLQTKLLQRYAQQLGVPSPLPPTFREYLNFLTRTLVENKRRGGVAVKFEASYFRSLSFGDPGSEVVEPIYQKYRSGGVPAADEYTRFQDFVFRHIIIAASALKLPVHIHTSAGGGDYFDLRGVNVLNLENVLRDPKHRETTFVLIHGGYPYDREAMLLASMKNVYLDSSATELMLYPTEFKNVLRRWLEVYPEKLTFGTDAFPYNDALGVEEVYWMGVHTTRTALAAALAEMIAAREISERQALTMARGYLHDNAAALLQMTPADPTRPTYQTHATHQTYPAHPPSQPQLRRVLGFRDLLLYYVVTGFSLRWVAVGAAAGPSALVIWVIAALGFFVPLVFCVLELSSRYPEEGGVYVWSKRAFGPFAAFITGWTYWGSNLPYLPGLLYYAAANALFMGGPAWQSWSSNSTYFIAVSMAGLALAVTMNVVGLNVGKWLSNVGAIAGWVPAVLLMILGVFAWSRFGSETPLTGRALVPSMHIKDIIFWSTIAFAFGGVESGSTMGEEIEDARRTVPRAILSAGVVITVLYIAATLAVLLAMPKDQVSGLSGIMQAIQAMTAKVGIGWLAPVLAALVTLNALGATGGWFAATARLPFVAGIDRFLPKAFGDLHPTWRTPYVALLVQAVIAGLFVFLGQAGTSVHGAYDALVSMGIIAYFIPFLFMFAAMIVLQREPAGPEVMRVPGGKPVAIALAATGFLVTAVSIVLACIPPDDEPKKMLAVVKVVGSSAILVGIGAVVYWLGRRRSQM